MLTRADATWRKKTESNQRADKDLTSLGPKARAAVRTCAVIRVRNSWWLRLRRPGESMTLVWFTAFTMSDFSRTFRVNANEGPFADSVLRPVDDDRRFAVEEDEHLLLVALGLVVLRDRLARRDLDEAHAERT